MNEEEEIWSIAEGKMETGKPYLLRFREFYPTIAEQKKYRFLIEITWNYKEDGKSGMPVEETYEKMIIFEDIFNKEIESQGFCFLLTSITGGGKKIWQIYSTDIDLFMQNLMK